MYSYIFYSKGYTLHLHEENMTWIPVLHPGSEFNEQYYERTIQVLLGELLTKRTVSFTKFLFMICPNDRCHCPFCEIPAPVLKAEKGTLLGGASPYMPLKRVPPPQLRVPLWKMVHKNDS